MKGQFMSLATAAKAFGHYIEQPAVIAKAEKKAGLLGLAAMAGIWGMDTWKAKPEERRKILLRDGLVLGATALGTILAARRFMMPYVNPTEVAEAREALKEVVSGLRGRYSDQLCELMLKDSKSAAEYRQVIEGMQSKTRARLADPREAAKAAEADLQQVLPVELDESFLDSLAKMKNFFMVGGISVVSGLLGGLAANKVNGTHSRENTINMIKEGIFQFIANIALCAVGASMGIAAVNIKPIKRKLAGMGMLGKLTRTGVIVVGLSLGIFGGGAIANYIGEKWVNPFFDKLQGKVAEAKAEDKLPEGKRKVEFWDAILHLDDLPTALALAGVAIMEPFIPLFFGFSGYRTGIGYRNDEAPTAGPATAESAIENTMPQGETEIPSAEIAQQPSRLLTADSPFQIFSRPAGIA